MEGSQERSDSWAHWEHLSICKTIKCSLNLIPECGNMLDCINITRMIWMLCVLGSAPAALSSVRRLEEVGVLQAWQYLSYFIVQILKGREWDVTIQNNEPPGSTFPGSHTVMSLDLLRVLQLIIEASPPPQTINATALQPSPSRLNEVVK